MPLLKKIKNHPDLEVKLENPVLVSKAIRLIHATFLRDIAEEINRMTAVAVEKGDRVPTSLDASTIYQSSSIVWERYSNNMKRRQRKRLEEEEEQRRERRDVPPRKRCKNNYKV